MMTCRRCLPLVLMFCLCGGAIADDADTLPPEAEATVIGVTDTAIARRIEDTFAEIPSLANVQTQVKAGVVSLTGTTADRVAAQRAEALAGEIDGVLAIENTIERDVSLEGQFNPAVNASRRLLDRTVALLPLLLLAAILFGVFVLAGNFLAGRKGFWQRITPNLFLAELAATSVRIIFIILGAVFILNLLGATALLGALLGSAGLIGLAVGFAVRDSIENYVASIMLSLRQPFRPKDHVVINSNEGHVIRLNSRATVLMTLDGNHLRIPNAEVYKATILNYSTNPERRFTFELGVDSASDPLAAIGTGVQVLRSLAFVLPAPSPQGIIKQVGDSSIILIFSAWISQRQSDFAKSRSQALTAVKVALEESGFELPEPIYRLRFDKTAEALFAGRSPEARASSAAPIPSVPPSPSAVTLDVSPDYHLEEKVDLERNSESETDLLDDRAPSE